MGTHNENHSCRYIRARYTAARHALLDTRCSENNLIGKFISDIVLQLLSFVAENERENIRHRQAEGIKLALEKGVKFGRPRIQLPPDFKSIADLYLSKQIGYAEALSLTAMRPTTFYRYVKEFTKNPRAI